MATTSSAPPAQHRQWGADHRSTAPSMLHPKVTQRRMALGRFAIVVTVCAWIAYFSTWLFSDLLNSHHSSSVDRVESIAYLLVISLPTASAIAYLLSRLGFFYRSSDHHRATRRELEEFYEIATPTLTAIVPSYQEDTRVIRQTLLSAALQEYPDKRVVLLIDDPPSPRWRKAKELLDGARSLPAEIEGLLAAPAEKYTRALSDFETAVKGDEVLDKETMTRLASHYGEAATWIRELAAGHEQFDHTATFLVNEVLLRLAEDFSTVDAALRDAARQEVVLPAPRIRQLYRRLAWTFRVEVSSFERKRFASLSSEPNKASNLNSYIGLMGGSFREIDTSSGLALVPCSPTEADLTVPNPDYVLTLDADSILLPDYCLRLVHLLERNEHRNVAIAQTPYSAFPGAATRLERIAGATTDIQHLLHQGLTYYEATFWVGANAVIRKSALDEIVRVSYIRDWEIREYISDRTVIEDTESTIELGSHGWKLFNYPERLSYSATPPDFGSLCIQRRRWANGGLLILPRLRRQVRARKASGERVRFNERFLRWSYMSSIAWSTVSLLVLLAFPFDATLINPLLGLVALPYFAAMASDLRYCGYKRSDIARIYGLNLILLPVNLAGTVSSLTQGITASKSAFARTPKVRDRTVTPAFFLAMPYILVGLAGFTFWVAYKHDLVENMGYAALNIALAAYAIIAFIGLRHSIVDAWVHVKSLLYKRERHDRRAWLQQRNPQPVTIAPPDWRDVLESGPAYARRWANPSGVGLIAQAGGRWRLTGGLEPLGVALDPVDVPSMPTASPGTATGPEPTTHAPVTFRTVFQPFVDLATNQVVGFEALSRFDGGAAPDFWLERAHDAGSRNALEGALARAALDAATRLPKGGIVAIKASLGLLSEDAQLLDRIRALGRSVIIEMAQPSAAETAKALLIATSLPANSRLALEHVGLDHWSLSIVSSLRPALVKLRLDVVIGIAADRARQAQLQAMVAMVGDFNGELIAVGIETPEDRGVLRQLGVHYGQGYLFGRPQQLVDA